jgi:hypothetical protein
MFQKQYSLEATIYVVIAFIVEVVYSNFLLYIYTHAKYSFYSLQTQKKFWFNRLNNMNSYIKIQNQLKLIFNKNHINL